MTTSQTSWIGTVRTVCPHFGSLLRSVGRFRPHQQRADQKTASPLEREGHRDRHDRVIRRPRKEDRQQRRNDETYASEQIDEHNPPRNAPGLPPPVSVTNLDEGQVARREKQDRSDDIRRPDNEVFLEPGERRNHGVQRVEVKEYGSHELQRTTEPADIGRFPTEYVEVSVITLSELTARLSQRESDARNPLRRCPVGE